MDRLPVLVLTHGDQAHIGGVAELAQRLKVEQLCLGPTSFRSPAYRSIREEWAEADRLRVVQPGEWIGPWRVLHPSPRDRFTRADDAALVLSGTMHGVRVLLCSDLGVAGQRTLLERQPGLRADLLVCGVGGEGLARQSRRR